MGKLRFYVNCLQIGIMINLKNEQPIAQMGGLVVHGCANRSNRKGAWYK